MRLSSTPKTVAARARKSWCSDVNARITHRVVSLIIDIDVIWLSRTCHQWMECTCCAHIDQRGELLGHMARGRDIGRHPHDRWQHVGARLRRRCLGFDNVLVHEPGQARRCRLGRRSCRSRGAPHPGQRGPGTGVQRSQRTATPHDSEPGRRPPRPGDRRSRLRHVIYGPRWAAARSGGASSSRSL